MRPSPAAADPLTEELSARGRAEGGAEGAPAAVATASSVAAAPAAASLHSAASSSPADELQRKAASPATAPRPPHRSLALRMARRGNSTVIPPAASTASRAGCACIGDVPGRAIMCTSTATAS